METAGDIIKDALYEISVLGAEAPVEPFEANKAIRYLNRMMFTLDARGVSLGYTEVSNLADNVTVPAGANEAIVDVLAGKLWRQFNDDDAPIPMDLAQRVRDSIKTLYQIGVKIGQMEYPDTLPIGSGNRNNSLFDSKFYADLETTILAETGGSVGLEGGT